MGFVVADCRGHVRSKEKLGSSIRVGLDSIRFDIVQISGRLYRVDGQS